ncbi:hypothetical protein GCM10023196_035890 [Actinoallomurus vinaceus]|uniref:Uncharacterized protein n=1 Tax=Actinoallomurus vinaceus TaxID=1080074 RepID=A0ABP8UAQ8_9ACTN
MPDPTEIPAGLVAYLAERDRHRARRVANALAERTPAERTLMKEAAVMGYVQGRQASRDAEVPPDSAILRSVVAACLDMPDLCPAISAHEAAEEATDA